MSPVVRGASFVLLPLVAFFEAFAWYGARSTLTLHLMEAGSSHAEIGSTYALLPIVALAGTVIAGLGAIVVGPWLFLGLGALVAATGAAALGVLPPQDAMLGVALLALGHGLVRPAVYGAAARAFGDDREHLRSSSFLLLWAASHVAAASARVAAQLTDVVSTAAFWVAAAGAMAAFIAAAGLGAAVWSKRASRRPAVAVRRAHLAVVFGLVLIVSVPWSLVTHLQFDQAFGLGRATEDPAIYMALNAAAVILLCVIGAAVFAGLHFAKVRFPTLLLAGVGLVLLGTSMTMLTTIDPESPETMTVGISMITMAIGEVLLGPLLLSRLTGDLPHRLETAVVALWTVAMYVPGAIVPMITMQGPSVLLGWVAAIAAVVLGVAIAVAAFPLRRVFEPADADEEDGPTRF